MTYYNGFGRRIAMRTHTGPSDPGAVHYLLADQLGSTSTILSAMATVEESAKYCPCGSIRGTNTITLTDKKFTGQQEEGGDPLGLYDYGARFYSTVLGRFISADPVVQVPFNPQNLNRYSYVLNNPLRYTDPTGLMMPGEGSSSQEEAWQLMHNLVDLGYSAEQIGVIMTGSPGQIRAVISAGPPNASIANAPAPAYTEAPTLPPAEPVSYTPEPISSDPLYQPAPVPVPAPAPVLASYPPASESTPSPPLPPNPPPGEYWIVPAPSPAAPPFVPPRSKIDEVLDQVKSHATTSIVAVGVGLACLAPESGVGAAVCGIRGVEAIGAGVVADEILGRMGLQ